MNREDNNEGFYIKGNNDNEIYVYFWENLEKPKAVILVFHGMAEHAARYGRFAQFMNSKGIAVYANDHRGHGRTAGGLDNVGYIGEDGFNQIIEDEHIITEIVKEKHGNIPIIILGHSFGSFIAQEYMIKYGENISGVILSGSSMMKGAEIAAGTLIASLLKSFFAERKKSYLLDKLSFGPYNRKIKNPKSKFAWLSRDEDEVRKYGNDEYCGTVFTINFYYHFFKGLSRLYSDNRLASVPKELPLLILAGDMDPVGKYGTGVKKLYENYKRIGLNRIEMKLYPGARHEILNEMNREEVFQDILNWISDYIC